MAIVSEYFKLWYFVFMFGVFLIAGIAVIAFARLSMARIERQIMTDGFPRPCPWDGPGARILWYAHAIAVPVGRFNRVDDPLIDTTLVRRYATRADVIRGWVVLVFSYLYLAVVIVGGFQLELLE